MQFLEYVFTITFVYVLNYPFEYPNYPNDFHKMTLLSFLSLKCRFCGFAFAAHMNMSEVDAMSRCLKIGTSTLWAMLKIQGKKLQG